MFARTGRRAPFLQGPLVSLGFPEGEDAVLYAEELIRQAGLGDRGKIRELPGLPTGRWIVLDEAIPRAEVRSEIEPLLSAAILGMSGPSYYCLGRPIVWTRERLGRVVSLHRLGAFYED